MPLFVNSPDFLKYSKQIYREELTFNKDYINTCPFLKIYNNFSLSHNISSNYGKTSELL
jgi:hypothetical protein